MIYWMGDHGLMETRRSLRSGKIKDSRENLQLVANDLSWEPCKSFLKSGTEHLQNPYQPTVCRLNFN